MGRPERTTGALAITVLRGMAGVGALALAIWLANRLPILAALAGIGALVAFGGCPSCRLVGLCGVLPRSGSCATPRKVPRSG